MTCTIKLAYKQVVELCPTVPFNFDTTMHKPDHFPSRDNEWQPEIRWQTMLWQFERLGLKFENCGTVAKPRIRLSVWSKEKLALLFIDGLVTEISYRYNLHIDMKKFNRRFRDDPQLGPVIRKWRGMRPLSHSSLYEYLIIAIVLQNCTVRRTVNMMQALFDHYGTALEYDGKQMFCFWSPAEISAVSEEELRTLKVGYRAKSIKRVSDAFAAKQIDELDLRRKTKEEQRQALLGLYGIGPASVEYILSDVFHRWDELDHISPWEQKIYSKLFFNRNPEKPISVKRLLCLFKQRFAGYERLAVNYIWEDLFWKWKHEKVAWLEPLIRL